MALPPLWKVRREVDRIRVKAVRFVGRHAYDPIRKPLYDATSHWWQRISPGRQALTDRVAVFVVFQPRGLAGSILLTLRHLRSNGYSVLVVSNGPLRLEDRATLCEHASVVLERPNVGYDFGAYRDGIRHLWSLGHDMSRLILMNDSTWFPLRSNDDSLARMEALGADLVGHVFKSEEKRKGLHDHLESHLLMVSRDFLQSDDFRRFWSRYPMSNDRTTTIAIGEKGFSQFALRSGWKVQALMGRDWLVSVLRQLDDAALKAVLDHTLDGFTSSTKTAVNIRRAVARDEPWRDAYLEWVHESLSNTIFFVLSGAFIMPAMVYGGMGFAKKGRDIPFHMARQELLLLEASGIVPALDADVRSEIDHAIRTWTPPKGQEKLPRQRSSLPVEVSG
jgi:Rhamnan synthesis protein F